MPTPIKLTSFRNAFLSGWEIYRSIRNLTTFVKNYKFFIPLTAILVTGGLSTMGVETVLVDWSVVEKTEVSIKLGASPFDPAPDPPQPKPAKIIDPHSTLRLGLAIGFGSVSNVKWFKDGELFASGHPEILFLSVTTDASGTYHATFSRSNQSTTITTQPAKIVVRKVDRPRIANQSSRVKISPDSPSATFGFVINPTEGSGSETQEMLIRAIGPALTDYGVLNPVIDPIIELRSSNNSEVIEIEFQDISYSDGSTWFSKYYQRVSDISSEVGAFPVTLPTQPSESSGDQAWIFKLEAGAYTVSVHSESNRSGEVLIEIYEISPEITSTHTF